MNRFFILFQFFPIAVFTYSSLKYGWKIGFELGALAAILEFIVLGFKRIPVSRLLGGANLFLIFGGISFFFELKPLLNILQNLRETSLFISILIFLLFTLKFSKTGVFELAGPKAKEFKKYSLIFILSAIGCVIWSYYYRGNMLFAGTLPFVFLIFVKTYLQRKMMVVGRG